MTLRNYKFKTWHGIAAGFLLYAAFNLSSGFREAKDKTFDDLKTEACQSTDGSLYESRCGETEASPDPE